MIRCVRHLAYNLNIPVRLLHFLDIRTLFELCEVFRFHNAFSTRISKRTCVIFP